MGMNTHVVGFKAPDKKWEKMKAVWDACEDAGIVIPAEVDEYFNYEDPDPSGVIVDLTFQSWSEDMREGIEVLIDELPEGLTSIRFYNSY